MERTVNYLTVLISHYHCLFFGLDFAMCERLFWRAWQFQGSIQVGAIRNGGIGYVVSYLDKQLYGMESFLKYDYNHLQKPFQVHSIKLGEGLYKSQLNYITEHDGNYRWHDMDKPVPSYYKNKFRVISDLSQDSINKRFAKKVQNIQNLYDVKIHTFKDLERLELDKAQILQKRREIKLVHNGKPIRVDSFIQNQAKSIINDKHRLPTLFDNQFVKIVTPQGNYKFKIDHRLKSIKDLKTRDFMKLGTSYNQLYNMMYKSYGANLTNQAFGIGDVPF